jgi:hypothetical protein
MRRWRGVRLLKLDELESAHRAVGGTGPGRRYLTNQINHASVVLLAAEWQGFCRDLHREAAQAIADAVEPALRSAVQVALTCGRQMDRGNADVSHVGADFARLSGRFWDEVGGLDRRNEQRKKRLRQLYAWRNAIVHQELDIGKPDARLAGRTRPTLLWTRIWRRAVTELVEQARSSGWGLPAADGWYHAVAISWPS